MDGLHIIGSFYELIDFLQFDTPQDAHGSDDGAEILFKADSKA